MTEVTRVERCWRCPKCETERKVDLHQLAQVREGMLTDTRWCADDHQPTVMTLVERERIYASEAERLIIDTFETSDWGLMAQAVEHYKRNRQSTARRNPGADRVLARGVYPRFDALLRACGMMRRHSHRDTENGGRIADEPFAVAVASAESESA